MEKKHVLILGAGLMQKPAVEAAHKLGCRVTLIDANPQAVCRTLAEKFEQIDLKNTEQICDFARSLKKSEGLDAVFTAGTDFSYAVACAAHECNLSAHTSQAAKNASDKVLMRSCFDKAGVPSPHFVQADSSFAAFNQKQAEDFIHKHKLDFPLVVKPCDNMGARGCRLVRGAESLADAVKDALRYSRTFRVIIEEYMDGSEFSIDSLVFDGQLTVTGFAERHIYFPPYFIEMGHTMPALIDKTDKERLLSAFWSGVKALGLSCGAAKADIKMTSKGPMIGEIAARLSGGYMSGWTYPYASDIDLTREAVRLALGEKPSALLDARIKVCASSDGSMPVFEVPCKRTCAERAWISIPGTVSEVLYAEKARAVSGVKDFLPTESGQYVYYKDATFQREAYVGFLQYDEARYAIRYYAPENTKTGQKEEQIELFLTVDTKKDYILMTGERIVAKEANENTATLNYLHDLFYEFASQRKKVNGANFKGSSAVPFSVQKTENIALFGGEVSLTYDYLIPIFNLRSITNKKGEKAINYCRSKRGRLQKSCILPFLHCNVIRISR